MRIFEYEAYYYNTETGKSFKIKGVCCANDTLEAMTIIKDQLEDPRQNYTTIIIQDMEDNDYIISNDEVEAV